MSNSNKYSDAPKRIPGHNLWTRMCCPFLTCRNMPWCNVFTGDWVSKQHLIFISVKVLITYFLKFKIQMRFHSPPAAQGKLQMWSSVTGNCCSFFHWRNRNKSLFVTTLELRTKAVGTFEPLWLCVWRRNCSGMGETARRPGICFSPHLSPAAFNDRI